MYEQSGNIILLIIGMIMLMIIVLIQCATGKRVKRINLSNNKSKTTQVSESSSRSVKKARRLQKEQMKREVENSKRSLPKKEESVKESSISKRSQTDNEFTRSNKSKSYRKMKNINNQSNETQQKTTSADTSAEIFEKSLTVIPTVNTGMSKNMEMAKPADAKCSDNQLYRVNPVFGFINPGEKLKVDIMRQKAMPKVDKMIFVSVRANKDDIFPRPLFKRSKDSQKVAMLPLLIARVI
ncbi:Sperm-specific class P protein [Dirofilaria immitis]